MKPISRREFLRISGLGAAGLLLEPLLSACSPGAAPNSTAAGAGSDPTEEPSATPQPSATTPAWPHAVVARGGEPEPLLRAALEALGGISAFVPAGANVIIKPNICVAHRTYEYAATTNPWLLAELARLCLEAGASRVRVMDLPFSGSAENAYVTSGIKEQVEAAGGSMEIMTSLKYVPTAIPGGVRFKAASVFQDALEADVLINVPIAKQHGNTRLSLGMKNLMGLVPGTDRSSMHVLGIHQTVADLNTVIHPTLTVVDAIRILTAGGPQGGNLEAVKKIDTLVISPDIVCADTLAAGLFGLGPQDVDYIRLGAEMGLGRSDLENLDIRKMVLQA